MIVASIALPLLGFLDEPPAGWLEPTEAQILAVIRGVFLGTIVFALLERQRPKPVMIAAGILLALLHVEMTSGLRFADPSQIAWVMHGKDGRWHHIAWSFFRHEPWQFPPGEIATMLYPVGTSVAYTDSVPLMALPLKLFDPWLPRDFQYLGLFFLGSALLRGVFAALLAIQLGAAPAVTLLATALIICGPSAFVSMDHAALSSISWLTLAALWLYFRPPRNSAWAETRPWLLLAGASAWVHPYVCVMTVAQSAAGIARRWWPDRVATARQAAVRFAAVIATVVVLWWIAGAFVLGRQEMSSGALGLWSMDLLSFVNPTFKSAYLPQLPMNPPQIIGAHYLGVGVLLLLGWSAVSLVRRLPSRRTVASLVPLFLVSLFFLLFALSPTITFAGRVILELPPALYSPLSPFRGSGRFAAPVAMTLLVLALRVLAKRNRAWIAAPLLLLCVLLQLDEAAPQRRQVRVLFAEPLFSTWRDALSWDRWEPETRGRRELRLVPDGRWTGDEIASFAYLAARNGLASGAGEAARVDGAALTQAAAVRDAELEQGVLHEDILYVAHTEEAERLKLYPSLVCRRLDGYLACSVDPLHRGGS